MPRLSRTRITTIAAIAALALLSTTGCSSAGTVSSQSKTPASGGDLSWAIPLDPDTLNPQLTLQDQAREILGNAYEPLLSRSATGAVLPGLARSYAISGDGRSYTVELRHGITFSDGEAFNAAAVVTNYTKLTNPAYNFGASLGAISHVKSVAARGTDTVVFTLKSRYTPFLDSLSSTPLISPRSFDKADVKAGGSDIAGTGPFTLTRYAKSQSITFSRRNGYNWAPGTAAHHGAAYLHTLTYRILPESSTRVGALTSGQVDVISSVAPADLTTVKSDAAVKLLSAVNPGTPYSIYFNTVTSPTSSRDVRTAFVDAVDLDAVVKSVFRGTVQRAWAPSTSSSVGVYDPALKGTYGDNPQAARTLLASAGWTKTGPDGVRVNAAGDRLVISIYVSNTAPANNVTLLQAIKAEVLQNAGIDFDIHVVDPGTRSAKIADGGYQAFENSQSGTEATPLEYLWAPKKNGGFFNFSNASDPKLLTDLTTGWSTTKAAARVSAYAALQKVIIDQQFVFPLYEPAEQIAANARVHGVGFRPYRQGAQNAYDVWLSRAS